MFSSAFDETFECTFHTAPFKYCGNRKQGGINIGMLLQSCSQPIVLLLLWTYQIILNYILFRKIAINAIVEGGFTERIMITNLQSKTNWGFLTSQKRLPMACKEVQEIEMNIQNVL